MSTAMIPLLLSLMITGANAVGSYVITGPQSVHPGEDYKLVVDILEASNVDVVATIQEQKYNGLTGRYDLNRLQNTSGTFSRDSTGILTLPINQDFRCEGCQIHVRGTGGLQFEKVIFTSVSFPVVAIIVQTDKALYKPEQTVHFRTFAVFPDLQLYSGGFLIEIRDANNNRIKVINNATSPSGVVQDSVKLSDQPVFGSWSISVNLVDVSESYSQTFEVSEYALPRFEVNVELPSFALVTDSLLTGKVKAAYTFGQPVKGHVELHIGPNQGPNSCGILPKTVQISFEIDGEASFSVPKEDIERAVSIYNGRDVRVTAFVTEDATDVRLNGSSVVKFYTNKYQVKITDNSPGVFKPGLPYTTFIQVSTPDDKPPTDPNITVSIYTTVNYQQTVPDQSLYSTTQFTGTYGLPGKNLTVPGSGLVSVEIDIPSNATSITVKASVKDVQVTKTVEKMFSQSNNFIQLFVLNNNIKSGDTIAIKVDGTEPLHEISYEVLSRGSLVDSGTKNGQGKVSFIFNLLATTDFAPNCHLLVYYTKNTDEIVADSLAINVAGIFKNDVTVAFSKNESEPNKDITINVSAQNGSEVFILAVDQSAILLKTGNDVTPDRAVKAVSQFDRGDKPSSSQYALSHSGRVVRDVFSNGGFTLLTDVPTPQPPPSSYDSRPQYIRYHSGLASPLSAPLARSDFIVPENLIIKTQELKDVDHVRQLFPEVFLWDDTHVGEDGTASISTKTPDTITSWILSGFATHPTEGLGVAPTTAKLTVFRSFFVSPTLPNTVVRGEQAVIQAIVFNYLPQDEDVVVTLKGSPSFQSVKVQPQGLEVLESGDQVQTIRVKSEKQGVVYFPILAAEIGLIDIEITAQSTAAADGVRRQIVVRPEGAPISFNYPYFVNLEKSGVFEDTVAFPLPASVVNGSDRAKVKVTGDMIGASLNSLTKLIELPTGCGEQSLVKFVPDLYIGRYLQSTGQLTNADRAKIVDYLEAGYQRQLGYQRSDGSFSAFGNSDESGSTWLTAISTRALNEATQFIYVDPQVVINGVDWLVDRQNKDGSFNEFGRVLDSSIQGTGAGPSLTAFVLLSLLENSYLGRTECVENSVCWRDSRWANATANSLKNLEDLVDSNSINDQFSLAVVSYALTQANSSRADIALAKLEKYSRKEGDLLFWSDNSTVREGSVYLSWRPPRIQSKPRDTVITSYAILALTEKGRLQDALPAVRWLIKQKGSNDGFASTQDTIIGLQALSEYAAKSIRPDTKLFIKVTNDVKSVEFNVEKNNALVLQIQELNRAPPKANIAVTGSGYALVEVDVSFYINEELSSPSFEVNTVLIDDNIDSFNLMICTRWLLNRDSGMVIQESSIPSGFEPDLSSLSNVAGLKRSERRGNTVVAYFDRVGKTSLCYSISMARTGKIARIQENYVATRAYYSPSDEATVFWQPKKPREATICDVCGDCCP